MVGLAFRIGWSNRVHTNQRFHFESSFTDDFKDTDSQGETK